MYERTAVALVGSLAMGTMVVLSGAASAQALTMKECSVKYKAEQAAGTLNGATWNAFRKAQCGSDAAAAPAAPAATAPPLATSGGASFPSAVAQRYSSETPGRARMHTCLDQYRANKASNANGRLVWVQKGGGYYSECNKRLKGLAL
jgi:hypothetical protein